MRWPLPQPGLVVRYSYLWADDARGGREEGSKDRPCAIILAAATEAGTWRVRVLPITHTRPEDADLAIEIPPRAKLRLGLDDDRSWIVLSESNAFTWPGPDLRPIPGTAPSTVAFGFLPPRLFAVVRDRYLALARRRRLMRVQRTE